MLALVVASALVSGTGPLPAGATDLTVLAGRPFYSVRVAHGITDRLDLGLGVDISPVAGLFRPLAQMRFRLWSNEAVQVALRGLVASVLARRNAEGFGPRPVARTGDGELGLGVVVQADSPMKTFSAKPSDIKPDWFVVDATDKVLGRLASQIALRPSACAFPACAALPWTIARTMPVPFCMWKLLFMLVTMPAASWPRCCRTVNAS